MVRSGAVTRLGFTALVGAVGLQRLWELRTSRRNEARLRELGAREHAPEQLRSMALVHGAWLAGSVLEVWLARRRLRPGLAALAGVAFAGGQALRYAAIRALGPRWTVTVMTLPGGPVETGGIYRYLRHPNYLGVILEIAALPVVHGAYVTAGLGSAANALVLVRRIRAEEAALSADGDYERAFAGRRRLVPRRWGRRAAGREP